ncbi:protein FAM209-like [Lycaon pictus]
MSGNNAGQTKPKGLPVCSLWYHRHPRPPALGPTGTRALSAPLTFNVWTGHVEKGRSRGGGGLCPRPRCTRLGGCSRATPGSFLSPRPKRHNGLCDITNSRAPGTRSPGAREQTHHEQLRAPALLTMRTLTWLLLLPVCLSCGYAFMFSPLRDKAKEPQGKVPCGGHFRIRQNLPEHAQGWLGSKWLWLFFVVVLYVILKFRGDSEKSKEQNPSGLRGCPFRSPLKKNQNASPNKDYAFNTLTQLEMDLVKFVSKVRNLKVAMATGSNLKLQHLEVPPEPHNNITIYEIWGEEDSE